MAAICHVKADKLVEELYLYRIAIKGEERDDPRNDTKQDDLSCHFV